MCIPLLGLSINGEPQLSEKTSSNITNALPTVPNARLMNGQKAKTNKHLYDHSIELKVYKQKNKRLIKPQKLNIGQSSHLMKYQMKQFLKRKKVKKGRYKKRRLKV